jgi:hypothetical protein
MFSCRPIVPFRGRDPLLLLHFDSCADVDKLLFDGLGFVFAHAFLNRFRRTIDEILGFFQTEAGNFTYRFDDIDLICAGCRQNNAGPAAAAAGAAAAAETPNFSSSNLTSCDASSSVKP